MLNLNYSTILKVSIPLMASTFIQSIVLITDSSFLSRYDTLAFDSAGNAGLIYMTFIMAIKGFGDSAHILIAKNIGKNNEKKISSIFWSTIILNLITSILLIAIVFFTIPDIINSYIKSQEIANGQISYLKIRSYGLLFITISIVINSYLMAIGKTSILLITSFIIAISNILLDYLLIFGNNLIPQMGIEGAAIASTISEGIGALFIILILSLNKKQKSHKLFKKIKYDLNTFKESVKIGFPISMQGIIGLSTWTIFFIWIEQIGEYELTISQTIRSIYFLAFIPIFGFAATTKTYVGQYYGKGSIKEIIISIKRILFLSLLFLLIFFHGSILYPDKLISIINPNKLYINDTIDILIFMSGSILIYCISSVFFQTINGVGKTKVTFYIEIISVLIYIISAYILIKIIKANIFWIWSVEYIYFASMGILSYIYLIKMKWKTQNI